MCPHFGVRRVQGVYSRRDSGKDGSTKFVRSNSEMNFCRLSPPMHCPSNHVGGSCQIRGIVQKTWVQLGSNNSSHVLLTAPKRAVGAVGFQSVTSGCVSFTAVTRVQIPSGTPSKPKTCWKPCFSPGTQRGHTAQLAFLSRSREARFFGRDELFETRNSSIAHSSPPFQARNDPVMRPGGCP
jgi:hypothetical protein